ncbi:radical SAM protein [Archaeoglobales archaeon]|nr:MAG: radical SAM protein [Archaeoglobales archaeon]
MYVIKPFDPWRSKLCTCPPKYSFNPYTGCQHNCLYCYSTYIPNFRNLRLKKDLFRKIVRDLEKLPKYALISMSNSSDPYPIVEKKYRITRKCLEIFKEYDIRLLIVTKGDTVVRDVDLMSEMNSAVSITITCDDKTAKILESNAPTTEKRIDVIKVIKDAGIPTVLRLDPIMPFINEDALWLIEKCEPDHVVSSTLKLRWDSFKRMVSAFPHLKTKYEELYLEGEKVQNYFYLPKDYRIRLLSKVKEKCEELGISYAFCRENIEFKAKSCDGSHLIC